MKELTKEQKAQRYDEAIDRAKEINREHSKKGFKPSDDVLYIFPELKENEESEDEKIRQFLIHEVTETSDKVMSYRNMNKKDVLVWLEKQGRKGTDPRYKYLEELLVADNIYQMAVNDDMVQEAKTKVINALSELEIGKLLEVEKQGEQETLCGKCKKEQPSHSCQDITALGRCAVEHEKKLADKVEPKFKIGDWVIDKQGIVHQIANVIENVTNHTYVYDIVGGGYFNDNTEGVRLWTIQDAKDGDVIYSRHNTESFEWIGIFKSLDKENKRVFFYGFWHDMAKTFHVCGNEAYVLYDDFSPATKEQRNLLFQKMHEAGYEWDVELKQLRKIEQKPEENPLISLKDFQEAFELKARQYDIELPNRGYDIHAMCKELYSLLIKQKPAWSEEDETYIEHIINYENN